MTESTAVEKHTGVGLALTDDQTWWSERQLAGLAQIGVGDASPGDQLVFLHVAQRTGLDPFARQIHMVSRNAKNDQDQWVKKWTIQTGIDGFRLIADRADRRDGTLREYEDTEWADAEGQWHDVWVKPATPPTAAKVTVLRNGKRFSHTVLYREYVQTKRNGDPNGMWFKMPANQLAKCAEAGALRKAYPQDLSGLYTDDEMGQADSHVAPRGDRSGGLAAVLEPDVIDVTEAEVLIEPGEAHDYVNDPDTGTCAVKYADDSVCGELENRPPHTEPETGDSDA